MATRKRNEWLEADESEDDVGYDSEEESRGRAVAGRSAKRRKTDSDSDEEHSEGKPDASENGHLDDEDEYGDNHDDDDDDGHADPHPRSGDTELQRLLRLRNALPDSRFNIAAFEDDDDGDGDDINGGDDATSRATRAPPLPKISKRSADAAEKAARRTGVLYLSRIPPFMKPSTLRSLLAPYGTLNRIFLTPESAAAHGSRVRAGGNRKKSYTDGWVEFVDKRAAKDCAALLNGRPVGGKGWYRDDVWVLKYLKGFKWRDLTSQLAQENAERAAKVRAEVARSTKEQKRFVEGVERGKMLERMQRRGRGDDADNDTELHQQSSMDRLADVEDDSQAGLAGGDDTGDSSRRKAKKARKSVFRQNEVRQKRAKAERVEQPEEVTRVLSKIF